MIAHSGQHQPERQAGSAGPAGPVGPTNPLGRLTFQGTVWIRRSDGLEAAVVDDTDPSSLRYRRALRLKDTATGRHFWGRPDRLLRGYHPVCQRAQLLKERFPLPARGGPEERQCWR